MPWTQVIGFSVLAYGLSWLWWAPLVLPHLSEAIRSGSPPTAFEQSGSGGVALGTFGPLIAAVIMRLFVSREGLRGSLGVRRSVRYYVVAVLAPAIFIALVILIDHLTGLGRFVAPASILWIYPATVVFNGVFGLPLTVGEEYGWRGYLLPRLLPLGEIKATLTLAAIWAMWHLPILLIGLNYPGQRLGAVLGVFVLSVGVMSFPFSWLYLASRQSVMVVAVMHSVLNSAGDTFTARTYIPNGYPLIISGGGVVSAAVMLVVIVWVYGPLGRRASIRTAQ